MVFSSLTVPFHFRENKNGQKVFLFFFKKNFRMGSKTKKLSALP